MNIKISTCSKYDANKGKDYNNDKVSKGWELKEIDWKEKSIIKLSTQYGVSGNEYDKGERDGNH